MSTALLLSVPLTTASSGVRCCQQTLSGGGSTYAVESEGFNDSPIAMTVFTNKYVYALSDDLITTFQLRSVVTYKIDGITLNSSIFNSNNTEILRLPTLSNESLDPLVTEEYNTSTSFVLANQNYVIVATAMVNNSVVSRSSVPLVVLSTAGKQPLTLAMVFHMHQPIYLNLEGQFEQPWVQVHTGGDFVYNGTWYGAYLWYIYMLEKHPDINATFNLQPTLLYQWNVSLNGFSYNGTFPGGQAALARDLVAINETVAGYRALASNGRIEILTSPFYHPLSAILVQLGWSDDLVAQIGLGKNYTTQFMDVTPEGMWTPEMGFTMPMVPIIANAGLRYTVLDEANQFVGAKGPSANSSLYQPFLLEGANGSHIIVFFRDTAISNDLFHTWANEASPRVAASDFIAAVASVYRETNNGVLTIALDGENPIVEGSEVLSALDFDSIFGAISSQAWLRTSTLSQIVAQRSVTAVLTSVPDGSWSGGFGLWIGSPAKDAIWDAISQARSTLVNLTKQYGSNNPEILKLWNYLYVAEGSDWEWQTPTGPAWFAMQGLRYAKAAETFVPLTTTATTSATGPPKYSPYLIPAIAAAAVMVALGTAFAYWFRRRR